MKKMVLKGANYAGYLIGCGLLGKLWGTMIGYFFGDFLGDEAYAAEHPRKYFLGVIGVVVLLVAGSVVLIGLPLNFLREFIDSKIDEIPDEDKEWD